MIAFWMRCWCAPGPCFALHATEREARMHQVSRSLAASPVPLGGTKPPLKMLKVSVVEVKQVLNISLNNTRRRLDKLYASLHFGMHGSMARRHPGHIIDRLRTGHESLRVRSVDPDLERQGRFRAVADGRVPDPGQVPDDGLAGGREGELAEEKAEDDLCTAVGRGSIMDGGVHIC